MIPLQQQSTARAKARGSSSWSSKRTKSRPVRPDTTSGSPMRAAESSSFGPQGQENPDIPDYPRAWFYPLLPWGAPISSFPPERLRGNTGMLVWELFTSAFILYVMVEVPYRLAFGVTSVDIPVCSSNFKIVFDVFSCLVFIADIVVQMHSAYFEENDDGQWELVDRLSDIRKSYIACLDPFQRSLLWDLSCCFPWIQVSCAVWYRSILDDEIRLPLGSSLYLRWVTGWRLVHFMSLLRVLKIWRLWKVSETAEAITRKSPGWANMITLVYMLFILFFAAHYLGCIWFAVGSPSPGHPSFESSWTFLEGAIWIPHDEDPGKYTRIIMQDPENGWKYEWLTAIYWAITTMTTIGYGDISAHNDHERIFCMIAMTLGSAYFAWLAGTVTGILAKGNAGQETFMAFLNEVGQFMDIKRFSKEIKDSVNVFYGLKYPTQLIFNDQEIMDSLPKGLRKRMQAETYMQTIETIPLFTDLSEAVKIEVCSGFETYYCSPEEQLTVEDEEPDALFVVRKGDVLLSSKGESVAVAQRGDMFGELGLLGLTETGRRLRTAVSISECELLRMSKENFRDLILAHGELRVSYRQLALRHVNNMAREAADPNSPIYDEDKLAYIHGAWQTGKFPDKIRIKGKVPPPVISSSSEVKEKKVTTQVNLDFKELKGLPLIHVAKGAVSVRIVLEYDVGVEKPDVRIVKYDTTVVQGMPIKIDFKALLKYKHTLDMDQAIVNRPAIKIKVVYLRWHDGGHLVAPVIAADLGFEGDAEGAEAAAGNSSATMTVGNALPAPHVETEIGSFTVSMADLVNAKSNEQASVDSNGHKKSLTSDTGCVLRGRWSVGGQEGDLELIFYTKVSRELPANSVIRSKFRSIWQRKREEMLAKAEVGGGAAQDKGGSKGFSHDQIDRKIKEIKRGLQGILKKGDAGKSGATATSFESVQEKATDELIKRLRDIKDQISTVIMFEKNFEMHMNEEMAKTLVTLDKRIEDALNLHRNTAEHLKSLDESSSTQREKHHENLTEFLERVLARIEEHQVQIEQNQQQIIKAEQAILDSQTKSYEAEIRTIEMVSTLDKKVDNVSRALEQASAESRNRDEHIVKLLEQITLKQGIAISARAPAPQPQHPKPPPPAPEMQPPAPPPKAPNSKGIGSVGLMLGQLLEVGVRGGKAKIHLQVQGVLPGGSAEMSGMFRAGDEIMAVDGATLDGKTLLEAKRLFLGIEGSMVHLGVLRPSTGKEFSLSLRRHVFTGEGNTDP